MKNNINEELFLRRQVRKQAKILMEQDLDANWGGSSVIDSGAADLYGTFVGPFVDVFKTAQVAFKDILSISIDVVRYSLAMSDEKRAEIKQRFREKRERYKGQYQEAMKNVDAAFSNPDIAFFGMMAAPHVFLGKGLAKAAWGTVDEPVKDLADDYLGGLLGTRDSEKYQLDAAATQNIGQSIGDALKGLFFQTEAVDYMDYLENVLNEQEEKKEMTKEPSDQEKERLAQEYLDSTGQAAEIEANWNELMADKQKEMDDILKDRKTVVDLLTRLQEAKSFQEASSLVNELKTFDTDLSDALREAQSIAQQQIADIKAGTEEGLKIMEDLKALPEAQSIPEDAPFEQYQPLLETGLLAATFGDAVIKAKEAGVGQLLGFVAEMSEDDAKKLAALSDRGKQYYDMIQKFKNDLLAV